MRRWCTAPTSSTSGPSVSRSWTAIACVKSSPPFMKGLLSPCHCQLLICRLRRRTRHECFYLLESNLSTAKQALFAFAAADRQSKVNPAACALAVRVSHHQGHTYLTATQNLLVERNAPEDVDPCYPCDLFRIDLVKFVSMVNYQLDAAHGKVGLGQHVYRHGAVLDAGNVQG